MRSGESLPINNTENNKQFSDMSEASESQTESGYERLDKIDISTNEGKFEWIDSLVDNAIAAREYEQYDILREEGLYSMDRKMREEYLKDNDAYQENKADLAFAKRQSKLLENLDIDGDGGVRGALERRAHYFALAKNNSKASAEFRESARQDYDAIMHLHALLDEEMARRNPKSFDKEETNKSKTESINEIDISTNRGKFEWLDDLVDNAIAAREYEQYDILREESLLGMDRKRQEEYLEGNDAYYENKADLALAKRQREILANLDIDGDGGVLGALERRVHYFALAMTNSKASAESMDLAVHNYEAASRLYSTLSSEVVRRDSKYFSQEEMSAVLKSEVEQAKEKVERTMVDEYFGTDGRHIASSGEKTPSPDTEDAEIDLEDANQDVKTFDLLMNDYDDYLRANNYLITQAVKKEDFVPIINKFIDTHTNQLNQLIVKSKTLTKGTPEYAENLTKRNKLAHERNSARRLLAKYFNIPEADQ